MDEEIKTKSAQAADLKSNRIWFHKARSKKLYEKAEQALAARSITNAHHLKFEYAANLFYQASLSFRACGKWREAGEALCRCARLQHSRLKSSEEAGVYFTEAAEAFRKVDLNEALKTLRSAVSIYCDVGRFDIAGKLQRQVAHYYYEMRHWDEAAEAFRKAADFLSNHPDQSDYCLSMAAECFVECEEYNTASDIYVMLAESYVQSNLKSFNARDVLLYAILCKMALPADASDTHGEEKYRKIIELSQNFEQIDFQWRCSKEALFVKNIIIARLNYDVHDFADHLYFWNSVKRLNIHSIHILEKIYQEVVEEFKRRKEEQKALDKEKRRWARRKERIAKKRRAMIERGLDPDSVDIEAEVASQDSSDSSASSSSGESSDGSAAGSSDESEGDAQWEDLGLRERVDSSESEDDEPDIELPPELREPPTPPRRRRVKK